MPDGRVKYEPFACAPGMRLEAHERVSKLQFEALNARLDRLEMIMERLERRLWLTLLLRLQQVGGSELGEGWKSTTTYLEIRKTGNPSGARQEPIRSPSGTRPETPPAYTTT